MKLTQQMGCSYLFPPISAAYCAYRLHYKLTYREGEAKGNPRSLLNGQIQRSAWSIDKIVQRHAGANCFCAIQIRVLVVKSAAKSARVKILPSGISVLSGIMPAKAAMPAWYIALQKRFNSKRRTHISR